MTKLFLKITALLAFSSVANAKFYLDFATCTNSNPNGMTYKIFHNEPDTEELRSGLIVGAMKEPMNGISMVAEEVDITYDYPALKVTVSFRSDSKIKKHSGIEENIALTLFQNASKIEQKLTDGETQILTCRFAGENQTISTDYEIVLRYYHEQICEKPLQSGITVKINQTIEELIKKISQAKSSADREKLLSLRNVLSLVNGLILDQTLIYNSIKNVEVAPACKLLMEHLS